MTVPSISRASPLGISCARRRAPELAPPQSARGMHGDMPVAHQARVDQWQYGPPRRVIVADRAPPTPESADRESSPVCEHRCRSRRLRASCQGWRRAAAGMPAVDAAADEPLVAAPVVTTRSVAAAALL